MGSAGRLAGHLKRFGLARAVLGSSLSVKPQGHLHRLDGDQGTYGEQRHAARDLGQRDPERWPGMYFPRRVAHGPAIVAMRQSGTGSPDHKVLRAARRNMLAGSLDDDHVVGPILDRLVPRLDLVRVGCSGRKQRGQIVESVLLAFARPSHPLPCAVVRRYRRRSLLTWLVGLAIGGIAVAEQPSRWA